jgi:hypothetical protein
MRQTVFADGTPSVPPDEDCEGRRDRDGDGQFGCEDDDCNIYRDGGSCWRSGCPGNEEDWICL